MNAQGNEVERLLASEDWSGARRAIRGRLRRAPDSHWLLSRLALTYYEQRRHAQALELELQALRLAPRCPLALWGLAGTLQMLERDGDAVAVYRRLIRRGADRLARGTCGEGIRWARGLVADCWYRLGQIWQAQGKPGPARRAFAKHLDLRRGGASIYSATEVRSRLKALQRGPAK